MTTITLNCRGAVARAKADGVITQGMVGIPVKLECDEAWLGLTRLLKARCGDVVRTAEPEGDRVILPYECLIAGQRLYIGLDGWDDTGALRLPSGWACCGLVQPSVADCDGEPGSLPSPQEDTVSAIYRRMEETEQAVEELSQRVEELPDSDVTEQTVTEWGFTKNTGDYTKPDSGIPETDLDPEVREKLNAVPALEDVPGNLVLYEQAEDSEEEQTIEALFLDKLTLEADDTYIYLKFGETVLGMVEAGSGGAETVSCTNIMIDQAALSINLEDTSEHLLNATVEPSDCTQLVRWSSGNPNVVTVSSAGVLTVVGEGTATITAKCGTKSASVTVTVVDSTVQVDIKNGSSVIGSIGGTASTAGNSMRAYSCNSGNTIDFLYSMEVGYTYTFSMENGWYYGVGIADGAGIIASMSGWTNQVYTWTAKEGEYFYVNFKYQSAGSATITAEMLEELKNSFHVKKEAA